MSDKRGELRPAPGVLFCEAWRGAIHTSRVVGAGEGCRYGPGDLVEHSHSAGFWAAQLPDGRVLRAIREADVVGEWCWGESGQVWPPCRCGHDKQSHVGGSLDCSGGPFSPCECRAYDAQEIEHIHGSSRSTYAEIPPPQDGDPIPSEPRCADCGHPRSRHETIFREGRAAAGPCLESFGACCYCEGYRAP